MPPPISPRILNGKRDADGRDKCVTRVGKQWIDGEFRLIGFSGMTLTRNSSFRIWEETRFTCWFCSYATIRRTPAGIVIVIFSLFYTVPIIFLSPWYTLLSFLHSSVRTVSGADNRHKGGVHSIYITRNRRNVNHTHLLLWYWKQYLIGNEIDCKLTDNNRFQ